MLIRSYTLLPNEVRPRYGNGRKETVFIRLQKEWEPNGDDSLLHGWGSYPLTERVALWISNLLDYYNGENESADIHGKYRYPETYKEWFNRDALWDCHVFAWNIGTNSIHAKDASFIEKKSMLLAGFEDIFQLEFIDVRGNSISLSSNEMHKPSRLLAIPEFESKLCVWDIVVLWTNDRDWATHSFTFIWTSPSGEGMYIQRVWLGWHITIASFKESCSYYPVLASWSRLTKSYVYHYINK